MSAAAAVAVMWHTQGSQGGPRTGLTLGVPLLGGTRCCVSDAKRGISPHGMDGLCTTLC